MNTSKKNSLMIEKIKKALVWHYKNKLEVLTVLDINYSLITDMYTIMYVTETKHEIKKIDDILHVKTVENIIKEYEIYMKKEGYKYE